jgi:hypothetical protein
MCTSKDINRFRSVLDGSVDVQPVCYRTVLDWPLHLPVQAPRSPNNICRANTYPRT